jgi:hypothetical protein
MKMRVQMQLECETCHASKQEWVPVYFHYSDGCYTVLRIDHPKCSACADKESKGAG